MTETPFELAPAPDWHAAASGLVGGLAALEAPDARVRLLEAMCLRLGQRLYPAFLQILLTTERFADAPAARAVAGTLVDCLVSGRLPSGSLPAWGGATLGLESPFGQVRRLGPIEYVCAWYAQPSDMPALSRGQLGTVLGALLRLVGNEPEAAALYRRKLLHDADDPLDGALSNRTREAVRALAEAWERDLPAEAAVDAYLDALAGTSLLNQIAKGPLGLPR